MQRRRFLSSLLASAGALTLAVVIRDRLARMPWNGGVTPATLRRADIDHALGIYAKAGEVMTCENGHAIATVRTDIQRRTIVSAAQFAWHIEPAPKAGDAMRPCRCGANYVDNAFRHGRSQGGIVAHFADGWRVAPLSRAAA